jgi:hypothetical protein
MYFNYIVFTANKLSDCNITQYCSYLVESEPACTNVNDG